MLEAVSLKGRKRWAEKDAWKRGCGEAAVISGSDTSG